MVRTATPVDLNDDGFLDIFFQPSWFHYYPVLKPLALLNDGTGKFYDGTDIIFSTLSPSEAPNNVFSKDFNNDWKVDIFLVDQGLEVGDALNPGFPGAKNRLYLQGKNAVFQDATATLPNNANSFNHVSALVDANNDGNLDILVTRLGGPRFQGSGVFVYYGDGKGGFSSSVAGLPEEIKYQADSDRQLATIDYQYPGSATAADFDNDGRSDLVSGSYLAADALSHENTIRFFQQQADGTFASKLTLQEPAAVLAQSGLDSGIAGIQAGDIDGDGLQDLVVHWEGNGGNSVELLKNLGGFQFKDVTLEWLPSYLPRNMLRVNGEISWGYGGQRLEDVNHDGALDLVLTNMNASSGFVASGSSDGAFLFLNDGKGHLSPAVPTVDGHALTGAELEGMVIDFPNLGTPMIFDTNNDGVSDFVFVGATQDWDKTSLPYKPMALQVATVFGTETSHIYRADDLGDVLVGSNGNDKLYGGAGKDSLDGGGGTDIAFYAGARGNYVITKVGAGFSIVDNTGKAVTDTSTGVEVADNTTEDTLFDIERIQFGDFTVNLGASDAAKTIPVSDLKILQELYVAFFNRIPDADGLVYWVGQLKAGQSLASIADSFYAAAIQYSSLTGYSATMSNDDFVKIIYKNVLGRTGITAPSAEETGYWSKELVSGHATKGSLVSTMLTSAHSFKGDQKWGWVPDLLDNKVAVANYFAVQQGLNYNSAEESISKGVAITSAITATDTSSAISLIGIHDPIV